MACCARTAAVRGFTRQAGIGPQGNQGPCCTGPQGNAGAQGNQGLSGAAGAPGGPQGAQGPGNQGNQGWQGTVGQQGFQGLGNQGNQGRQGNQGNQGWQGAGTVTGTPTQLAYVAAPNTIGGDVIERVSAGNFKPPITVGVGTDVTLGSGDSSNSDGGDFALNAGDAGGATGDGGSIDLSSGDGSGSGNGGPITLTGGDGGATGSGGPVEAVAGSSGDGATGGELTVTEGAPGPASQGGGLVFVGGVPSDAAGLGGIVQLTSGGQGAGAFPGDVVIDVGMGTPGTSGGEGVIAIGVGITGTDARAIQLGGGTAQIATDGVTETAITSQGPAPYNVAVGDSFIQIDAGALGATVNLDPLVDYVIGGGGLAPQIYLKKIAGAGAVTINATGGDSIDGAGSTTLTNSNAAITLFGDIVNGVWRIVARYLT